MSAEPAPDFSISLTPTSGTVTNGSTATITVTVTPINGFSAATSLACSGLPANATCLFNPASVTPSGAAATSTLTIASNTKAAYALPNPQLPISQKDKGLTHGDQFAISAASLFVIFGLGFTSRKARKDWMRYLDAIAFLALIAGAGTGCGTGSSTKTPPGQYSVTVTGTLGSLTHSATYSITVK